MAINLFIGPYVEFHTACEFPDCPEDLTEDWERLLEDHERLEWNFSRGDPPIVMVRGRSRWLWCAVPIARRGEPPRWPLLLDLERWWTGDFFSIDLPPRASGVQPGRLALHLCTAGTPPLGGVAPQRERDWFAAAYAEELRLLRRVFGRKPLMRWGVVAWRNG